MPVRTLYLTGSFTATGREAFRGRTLAEAFSQLGEILIRHTLADDRHEASGDNAELE